MITANWNSTEPCRIKLRVVPTSTMLPRPWLNIRIEPNCSANYTHEQYNNTVFKQHNICFPIIIIIIELKFKTKLPGCHGSSNSSHLTLVPGLLVSGRPLHDASIAAASQQSTVLHDTQRQYTALVNVGHWLDDTISAPPPHVQVTTRVSRQCVTIAGWGHTRDVLGFFVFLHRIEQFKIQKCFI